MLTFEHQRKNRRLAFFETYGVVSYGSGRRKDVVNQCLEFASKPRFPMDVPKIVQFRDTNAAVSLCGFILVGKPVSGFVVGGGSHGSTHTPPLSDSEYRFPICP